MQLHQLKWALMELDFTCLKEKIVPLTLRKDENDSPTTQIIGGPNLQKDNI